MRMVSNRSKIRSRIRQMSIMAAAKFKIAKDIARISQNLNFQSISAGNLCPARETSLTERARMRESHHGCETRSLTAVGAAVSGNRCCQTLETEAGNNKMNGNDLLYIPAGTTREGPVRENNLINLVGINLFKIRIHRPWLPLMEQLEPTLPSS